MNLGIIFTVILLPLVLAEVGEISPWLARWVLRWGAKCIGDRDATERYTEEWLAGIEDTPGKITKLLMAFGIVLSAVPALHWRSRKFVYRWPILRTADALVTVIAPEYSRKMRYRRLGRFDTFIADEPEFHTTRIEAVEFMECAEKVHMMMEGSHILPAAQISVHGSLKMITDYKNERIIILRKGSPDKVRIREFAVAGMTVVGDDIMIDVRDSETLLGPVGRGASRCWDS